MDVLKVFLVFCAVFWQQVVFGRPRTATNCKTVDKFKQDYSNNIQIMLTNMQNLFLLTKSQPAQPTIAFPPSYLSSIKANTKTMDRLDAYFKEMDKYTAYLSGTVSVSHTNLLHVIKTVGSSVEKYCNCPPSGKQYFVSTTPSTPVKTLSKKDTQYVNSFEHHRCFEFSLS